MSLEINDRKWLKNYSKKNQEDPFVRYLICHLLQNTKDSSINHVAEKLIRDIRSNEEIGLITEVEIDNFIDNSNPLEHKNLNPDFFYEITQEAKRRVLESIEAVITRVAHLLEEKFDPKTKSEFIDTPNKEIINSLRKIPVEVKWQLAETLSASLFCDSLFNSRVDINLADNSNLFRNQFEHSRWKEIESESLLFSLIESGNIDELIINKNPQAENFIKNDIANFVQQEIISIESKIRKKECEKRLISVESENDDDEEEDNNIDIPLDELSKFLYQFCLAIFYDQILSKPKKLYSGSLLERCLSDQIIKIKKSNNCNIDIEIFIKTANEYIKRIEEIWKNHTQK